MQVMACKTSWQKVCSDPAFEVSCNWTCMGDPEADYSHNAYYFTPVDVQALPVFYSAEDFSALKNFIIVVFVIAFGVKMLLKLINSKAPRE